MRLQKNGEHYDPCEQLSSNTQGAVMQLPTALPWDTSVIVRPLKSNSPFGFFFLTVMSLVCSLSLHNLMIQGFGSNTGLHSPTLSSIPCYLFSPQATVPLIPTLYVRPCCVLLGLKKTKLQHDEMGYI